MTANQIEYWKLQETKRHNVATEQMEKPLKESQTAYNYASIDLIGEQIKTQGTVQVMNLATANERYTASLLNEEKTITEQYNQNLLDSKTQGQNLINEEQGYTNTASAQESRYNALWYGALANDLDWNGNKRSDYADRYNWNRAFGITGADIVKSGAQYAKLFVN